MLPNWAKKLTTRASDNFSGNTFTIELAETSPFTEEFRVGDLERKVDIIRKELA